jgi:hypothetical protein
MGPGEGGTMSLHDLAGKWLYLVVVFALSASAVMPGCVTRRQGVDMSGFRAAMPGATSLMTDISTQGVQASMIGSPETVVLARVSARSESAQDEYRDHDSRVTRASARRMHNHEMYKAGEPDMPWVVEEGVNDRQNALVNERERTIRVVRLSQLVDAPVPMSPQNIISTAKARGADWLCVYSAQTGYRSQVDSPYLLVQLLTLGMAPTVSDAKSEIEMIIIDLRNDAVVDQWRGTETGWQPAIGWTHGDASQQSADRAETRALRTVLDRVNSLANGETPGKLKPTNSTGGSAWD